MRTTMRTDQLTALPAMLPMNRTNNYYMSSSQEPELLGATCAGGTLIVFHPPRERRLLNKRLRWVVLSPIRLCSNVFQHCDLGFANRIQSVPSFAFIPQFGAVRQANRRITGGIVNQLSAIFRNEFLRRQNRFLCVVLSRTERAGAEIEQSLLLLALQREVVDLDMRKRPLRRMQPSVVPLSPAAHREPNAGCRHPGCSLRKQGSGHSDASSYHTR